MQEIKSLSQFNKLKTTPLLIIDFYAVWCGPCKAISPIFDRLAKQHEGSTAIVFAKVNVDKAKDVAQECGISAMPTFQFFKDGKFVDEVKGADVPQLTTKIGYYTAAAVKESAGKDSKPTGGSKATNSETAAPTGPGSLRSLIDIEASKLVNTSNLSSIKNITNPPPAGHAISSISGSSKLLIHLSFTQAVTPTQVKFTVAKDSMSSAPARIQIGTNVVAQTSTSSDGVESSSINLDSLDKAEATQSFNVFSDEYVNGTAELKLKASKFKAIKSLTIRADANLSGEASLDTKITQLDIIGSRA